MTPNALESSVGQCSLPRPRVAWFSLLPDNCRCSLWSASAYCTKQLLPLLRERCDIEVFSEQPGEYLGLPVFSYTASLIREREQPYDVHFYQFEDRPNMAVLREIFHKRGGIAWFHDFYLRPRSGNIAGDFFPECCLAEVALFSTERNLIEFCARVSGSYAEARKVLDTRPVSHLPHPVAFDDAPPCGMRRGALELPPIRIISCGSPQIEHRIHKVLPALRSILSGSEMRWEFIWMIDEAEQDAARIRIAECPLPNIHLLSPRSPDLWSELLNTAALAIHTLFSAYGDPFPFLAMSMSRGVPSIVTRFSAMEFLPDAAVWKIPPAGSEETHELEKAVSEFLTFAVSAPCDSSHPLSKLAQTGALYAREVHDREVIAAQLYRIFSRENSLRRAAPRFPATPPSVHN